MIFDSYNPARFLAILLTIVLGAAASGCGIFDEGDPPTSARVTVEGGGGASIRLVSSNDFSVTSDDDGETRDVFFYASDTMSVTPPFEDRFSLGSARRIFVQASSDEALNEPINMRVYLNGEERYNATSTLDGVDMEFLFTVR